jgi:lipid-binding SYLF domain-containing protein
MKPLLGIANLLRRPVVCAYINRNLLGSALTECEGFAVHSRVSVEGGLGVSMRRSKSQKRKDEDTMKRPHLLALWTVGILFLLCSAVIHADTGAEAKLEEAGEFLTEIMEIPDKTIPLSMFRNAHAIAVIPNVLKVGFFIGGRHGEGLISIRDERGDWSYPIFITLSGGSIGWQVGAQSADIILVFKSRESAKAILEGKFTLGVDAAIAAGPIGRQAAASTDIELEAEIFSYALSKGFFAGLTIEGSVIRIDKDANMALYGEKGKDPEQILNGRGIRLPKSGRDFLKKLEEHTDPRKFPKDPEEEDEKLSI